MSSKKILIASDHAGLRLKAELQTLLKDWTWIDLGPTSEKSVDYPDFAKLLTTQLLAGVAQKGILICGSGIGMSIAANKVSGIRAAVLENPVAARLTREHNDTNVLCLGSRFLAPEYAAEIAQIWLSTPFSENPRHAQRIDKIHSMERNPTSEET